MIILGTNSIKDTGYNVDNSLRFNEASSDKLTRSNGTPTSQQKFTHSVWVKRSTVGNFDVMQGFYSDANNYCAISFLTSDRLDFINYEGSTTARKITTAKFRDVSAFYHICVAVDTTLETANDRIKIYVNGLLQTVFDTNTAPSEDASLGVDLSTQAVGVGEGGGIGYVQGYLAESVYIDGTQNAVTDFGEFDEDSGIWKPIDVSGLTFGTNGFYLEFKQSGTSQNSSGLGADTSGNDNHFAVNNLTAIDQSTDTCTNNFATMNPLDNYYAASTFSEGNLKTVQGSSRYAWNLSTMAVASGKWYAEVKFTTSGSYALIGITDRSPLQNLNDVLGSAAYDYSIYQPNGDLYNNAGLNPPNDDANYAASYANGDIIGIALDCDNNKLYFSKGGAWSNGSGSWDSTTFNASTGVVTITAPASTNNGNYFFAAGDYESGSQPTFEWNFGSPSFAISSGNQDGNNYGNFEYAVPSGYFALNTKNLAEYG